MVAETKNSYTVYRTKGTASYPDSSYEKTDDGLSIALARAWYLTQREGEVNEGSEVPRA